ncbi:MAG: isochorismatase family protein [Actinomycetota bacterium]|nr:isochorismatase family protein [Actinomycetota bacterium]
MTGGYDNTTGLIVVDVQNDFADPNGNLYVNGGEQIMGAVNEQVASAVAAGATVVYTQDWHPPDTPHFEKDGGIWPVHCVADTWGAEFHPELSVVSDAEIVRKGVSGEDGYSAFSVREPDTGRQHGTGLEDMLWERGVQRVVVVGLATDYCVKETVLDARRCGLAVTVVADGIRSVDLEPGDGERALEEMQGAGAEIA